MHLPSYQIEGSSGFETFEFVSEGPKGAITKRVQYTLTENEDIYNLGFGDVDPRTGRIDDSVVTNNGDTEMVLATVVKTLMVFSENHPKKWVFAQGSSPARTRLYQMGISKYLDEVSTQFEVFGLNGEEFELFRKGVNYQAYIAKRRESM